MKYFWTILATGFTLCSCRESAIRHSFSAADSLVIHFKNEQAGMITKTVQTAEYKAISRMIDFIDGKKSGELQCGYDGKMYFFSQGQKVQEVDFNMKNDSCRHFAFMLDGSLIRTGLNHEAADFFDALEKGLPYYY